MTFVQWYPAGFIPNNSRSSINESQVRGCQLLAWEVVVNAQTTVSPLKPRCTRGFSVTY